MSVSAIFPLALTIGVAIIGVSIVSEILSQLQSTQTPGGAAYNTTQAGLEAMSKWNTWFPIIVTVIAAVIVIGLLMYFRGRE